MYPLAKYVEYLRRWFRFVESRRPSNHLWVGDHGIDATSVVGGNDDVAAYSVWPLGVRTPQQRWDTEQRALFLYRSTVGDDEWRGCEQAGELRMRRELLSHNP